MPARRLSWLRRATPALIRLICLSTGLDQCAEQTDVIIFSAGMARQGEQMVTAGGRVMAVTAVGSDLPSALQRAYTGVEMVAFDGMHYRRDIGQTCLVESCY